MAADAEGDQKSRTLQVSSTGFCYSGISPTNNNHQHLMNQIQTSSYESNPSEMFNLTTGMEIIGFFNSNKQGNNGGGGGPSSSSPSKRQPPAPVDNNFYSHEFIKPDFPTVLVTTGNHLIGIPPEPVSSSWQDDDNNNNRLLVDDSSLRCVFSCEGNERPSQGLSLTLSSTNPSAIGLQSFELRQHQQQHPNTTTADELRYISSTTSSREGYFGKPSATASMHTVQPQQQQMMMQTGGLFQGKVSNLHPQHHQQFHLRNSKYLGPAQELLNEFCSLGTKQNNNEHHPSPQKQKIVHKFNDWEGNHHQGISGNNNGASSSSNNNKHLYTLELMELQKRKAKLLSMLDEVDRRYKHYCDQMKAVVSSFEEVAGKGAAKVYSALASNAMSKHFRCLRDGIVGQIHATRKAMGEKDEPIAPGTTRGETPRLRLLDQTLRQQRAFQQMNMMENHPWRPQRGLPERSVSVLRAWLFEHFLHPYPSDVDKHILARQTGLSRSQVSNWFINARVRLWKPMVEEMYLEETKEELQDSTTATNNINMSSSDGSIIPNHHQDAQTRPVSDQKPTQEQLVRIDSECLSSIINNNHPEKVDHQANKETSKGHQSYNIHPQHQQQQQGGFGAYGGMELDFSSYNQNAHQEFGGVSRGGGVSLTLGLQQHGGAGGVSLAFSPTSQSSLFYARDHIEDNCQPVQYSILDGDQGQNNLPYRNLLGAQLLHDLAG